MNTESNARTPLWIYAIGVAGTFLIMAALVWVMYYFTRPADLTHTRGEERRKNLADLNAATREQSEGYAWIDEGKGLVRLPINHAVQLVVEKWPNSAALRSNLLERVDKATFRPPPPPNPFE